MPAEPAEEQRGSMRRAAEEARRAAEEECMETSVSEIAVRMIEYSEGNCHDISHLLKVWSFARMIAEREGVPEKERKTAEIAALVHDIACPLCRRKYGSADGKHQEEEGVILAEEFLREFRLPGEMKERIVWLVGHHHTLTEIQGIDYQILIEADYLVNADESGFSRENIENTRDRIFCTATGRRLLESIYLRTPLNRFTS